MLNKIFKKCFNSKNGFVRLVILYFFSSFVIFVISDYIFYIVANQESKMTETGFPIFEEELKFFSELIVSFSVPFTAFLFCLAVLFAFFYSSFLYILRERFNYDFDILYFLIVKFYSATKFCSLSYSNLKQYVNCEFNFQFYFLTLLQIDMDKNLYQNAPAITLRLIVAFVLCVIAVFFSWSWIFFLICYRHQIDFNAKNQLVIKNPPLAIPNILYAIFFFTVFLFVSVLLATTFYVILYFVVCIYILCAMHITYITLWVFHYNTDNLDQVWWALRFFMENDELEKWQKKNKRKK